MTATYPAARSVFLDGQARNESAAIAGLARELALWQNSTYARDLKITPADSRLRSSAFSQWSYGGGAGYTPANRAAYPGAAVNVADIYLPNPRGPFRSVRVWVNVVLAGASEVGSVFIDNAITGVQTEIAVSYAALGSSLSGWLSADAPGAAGETLRLSIFSNVTSFRCEGVSAYWAPPAVAGVTQAAWGHVDPAALSRDDGPYSTMLLRWMARASNAHWYQRPLQVCASWLSGYGSGTTADWALWPRCVGKYRTWIGARVSSIGVALQCYNAGASATVTVAVTGLGGATATITVPATGHNRVAGTITFTALASGGDYEITVTVDGNPAAVEVRTVEIEEAGTGLALVGGATVPAEFVPIDDGAILSRAKILRSDTDQLLANLLWLWTYRRVRSLVCDSRFCPTYGAAPFGIEGGAASAMVALHSITPSRFSPNDTVADAGWMIRMGMNYIGTTNPGGKLQAVTDDSAWAELAWAPEQGPPFVVTPDQAHWQHRQAAAYADTARKSLWTKQIDVEYFENGATAHAWTIIEELPLGTPMLIGAP